MSDIDFVELDKAVNNLVNKNNPKPAATPPQPAVQAAEPTNHVSHKASGRFMDVFHHSSDMMGKSGETPKKTETTTPPPRKVLNPIYNDIKASPKTNQPPQPPTEHANENLRKSDWPDPIEAASSHAADVPSEEPVNHTPPPPVDASSLFLPDTKVEKRPLGGFNADTIPEGDKEVETKEPSPESEVPPPVNVAPAAELPPELGADLVAIEEGGSAFSSAVSKQNQKNTPDELESELLEDDEHEKALPEQKPSQPDLTPTQPSRTAESETKPLKKEELSGLLAAGSIPQQYKTAAASTHANEPTHPIFFDADQYNKAPDPGAHKASHKTSVFQWIFIIVGLLLLGATLGAALFVFVSNS